MTTNTLPALVVRPCEHTPDQVSPMCGQAVTVETPVILVDAGTIADIYDVWPTRPCGKRTGPHLLVIELKRRS